MLFFKKRPNQVESLEQLYKNGEFSSVANINDIFYCFRLILGRNPNPEECMGHSGMAGNELTEVVKSYVQSMEFQNRNLFQSRDGELALIDTGEFKIYIDTQDQAVGSHVAHGAYEPHVTQVFRDRLKPGMRVLDIGANIGYFSLLSSTIVGENGHVFSIEPNSNNCRLLQASKSKNHFQNIEILQIAASDSAGLLAINTSYSNGTTSGLSAEMDILMRSNTVPAFKIDNLKEFDQGVDFIKIDVEGAEYRALKGAEQLLARFKPMIVSEFSPTAMPSISGVEGITYLKFLNSLGYSLNVINPNGGISQFGDDIHGVMRAFEDSGVDHIDLFANQR
jgi:FkbM family methyltransferase